MQRAHFAYFAYFFPNSLGVVVACAASIRAPTFSSSLYIPLNVKKSMKSMQSMQEPVGLRHNGFWRCILFAAACAKV
jgi:hypothetical protein